MLHNGLESDRETSLLGFDSGSGSSAGEYEVVNVGGSSYWLVFSACSILVVIYSDSVLLEYLSLKLKLKERNLSE